MVCNIARGMANLPLWQHPQLVFYVKFGTTAVTDISGAATADIRRTWRSY